MKYLFSFLLTLLIFSKISAGIIYTDLNFHQHNPLIYDWIKTVDVNKDGTPDFTFSGNSLFHDLELQQEASVALCFDDQGNDLHFFQLGDSVNGALDYTTGNFLLVHMDTLHMPANSITYLGFAIQDELSGKTYYGWISMKLDIFHQIFYLYEAAISDEDGKSIAAGQTGVTIPENPLTQISIVANTNGLYFDNLPPGFRGIVCLYDLNGRLLVRKEITCQDAELAVLPGEMIGLLTLVSGNDRVVRKLLLSNKATR